MGNIVTLVNAHNWLREHTDLHWERDGDALLVCMTGWQIEVYCVGVDRWRIVVYFTEVSDPIWDIVADDFEQAFLDVASHVHEDFSNLSQGISGLNFIRPEALDSLEA